MEVEEAIKKLGFCGRWQISLNILFFIAVSTPAAWQIISIVWIGYRPPQHCKIPDNSSVREWIPSDSKGVLSPCSMFVASSNVNETKSCVDGWQFEEMYSGPTVVTTWNLVCERAELLQLSQMTFTFGVVLGAFIFTRLSDKLTRKWICIINIIFMSFFGILGVTVDNINLFILVRFFIGFFQQGSIVIQMIYMTESFSNENLDFYLIIGSVYWGLAISVLPLIAYISANWVYFELFISVYGFVFLPIFIWWLPETVVWLHANNRFDEAEEVMMRAAKMNRVVISKPIFRPLEADLQNMELDENNMERVNGKTTKGKFESGGKYKMTYSGLEKDEKKRIIEQKNEKMKNPTPLMELLKNRHLMRHMTLALVMLTTNIGYYGVTYISASLSTNHFVSGFLNAIVEVPACMTMYFIIYIYGKKKPIIFCQVSGALSMFACVLTVTFEKDDRSYAYVTLTLNLVFKFFISACNSILFIYGVDLFPNHLRKEALGVCMFIGRIGTIVTAFSSYVIQEYPRSLFAAFGAVTLLGGLLTLVLPETIDREVPETVEDVEEWYLESDESSYEDLSRDEEN